MVTRTDREEERPQCGGQQLRRPRGEESTEEDARILGQSPLERGLAPTLSTLSRRSFTAKRNAQSPGPT